MTSNPGHVLFIYLFIVILKIVFDLCDVSFQVAKKHTFSEVLQVKAREFCTDKLVKNCDKLSLLLLFLCCFFFAVDMEM